MAETQEQKESAFERLRDTLTELYGDEKKLIIMNRTTGVVSIGFGERGDQGGYQIPRSKLPISLTDEYSADTWLKSSDFRRALTKRWIEIIPLAEAENLWRKAREREMEIAAMAGNDGFQPQDVRIAPVDSDDAQDMVIDEQTATLKPALEDENVRRYLEYEGQFEEKKRAKVATPPAPVISDDVSPKAQAVVEELRRGAIQPLEAVKRIDEDEPLFTDFDLNYIKKNSEVASVNSFVDRLLIERAEKSDNAG